MLAYPRAYRQGHADEIVTTMLEMAEDGQRHPTASDAWHLFVSGVRQRFRLPAGRPLLRVAAVFVTLIAGAFGTAAGSWAAEQAFADLPGDDGVAALTRQVAGGDGHALPEPEADQIPTTGQPLTCAGGNAGA